RRSCRCSAPIHFLAAVPTLHTKFWQRAGRDLMLARAVHVLLPGGILWRSQVALPHVILSLDAPVLFLPSRDEKRIHSIGTREARTHICRQPATCFGNLIAWFPFTFHTPSLRNS